MKLTLKIFEQDKEILTKVLSEGAYRAGRSEFCDIVLPGNDISRSHLEIRVTGASAYVTNMSGAGRVKVNGERIETAELKDGDQIHLGGYRIQVYQGEVAEEAPAPQADASPADAPAPSPTPDAGAMNLFGEPEAAAPLEMGAAPSPSPEPAQAVAEVRPVDEFPMDGNLALKNSDTQVDIKPVVAKLLFSDGPRKGEEVPLEGYEVILGRSRKADIFIDDEKLSRRHAKIVRVGLGFRLVDLESRYGTYVNGVRVLEHPLSSFDVIELGKTKIKFLILDVAVGDNVKGGGIQIAKSNDPTKSMQIGSEELGKVIAFPVGGPVGPVTPGGGKRRWEWNKKNKILAGVAGGLVLLLLLMQIMEEPAKPKATATTPDAKTEIKASPAVPREFSELSEGDRRKVEGFYNSALRYAEKQNFEDAYQSLRKMLALVPYFKDSKKLEQFYYKKVKEKMAKAAEVKATTDRQAELQMLLEDGIEYLKEGDFARAEEAFNQAAILDPRNQTAAKGIKAAQARVRDIEQLPPDRDPEQEKKKLVADLLGQALSKFQNKSYQESIEMAEKVRKIEIRGETEYLNQAKQLIDRSRMAQKEEFEPFLIQAKEKYAEGDYNASRDLCDEMLKRDTAYDEAKECSLKAKKQLNRLAKEAYTHGYILESMNRLDEAKQYWNRAKNYVRPGDDYYDKIIKKLEQYQ